MSPGGQAWLPKGTAWKLSLPWDESPLPCHETSRVGTEPRPLHPLLPQPPALAPHASAPLASSPQLPFPPGSTVTFADRPCPSPNPTLPHRRSPTRSGQSPGSTSSHTHTHPPHFLALASLPAPKELSPASPRSPPHPKPLHPATAGSSPPAPRPTPGIWSRHPLDSLSCLPPALKEAS